MSSSIDSVKTVVYFNGSVTEGRRGVVFEGERRATRIRRNFTIDELHQRIRQKLDLQGNQTISMVTARVWQREQFITLPVADDEDLDIVMDEFFNQSRKDFLELYADIIIDQPVYLPTRSVEPVNLPTRSVEPVNLPMRSVDFNYAHNASSSAGPAFNISEEDENDPTWVMDDDYEEEDDDENFAMEDHLLEAFGSASDDDEECNRSATRNEPHNVPGESRVGEDQALVACHQPQHGQGKL